MTYTEHEQTSLSTIGAKLARVSALLAQHPHLDAESSPAHWLAVLTELKTIVGNNSSDLAFIGGLLAKEYLMRALPIDDFDVAVKPMGARGLAIDIQTRDAERVIGEIKTTKPFYAEDLGEKQREAFDKDFVRLNVTPATHKFFFITDAHLHAVVVGKYAHLIPPSVRVLLLPSPDMAPEA